MTDATRMLPDDEHNRKLIENVHPGDWVNPRSDERYHLAVIGAGTAGLVTAAIAVALGARVAMIERRWLGGDCLNVGCVPSKAILEAARSWEEAGKSAEVYGGPKVSGEGSFGRVMERMREIRAGISPHDSAERFAELGVDVYLGEAVFGEDGRLMVEGAEIRYRRCVIATGGRPAVPPIEGLEAAGYLTNDNVFELTELPARLAVIGGGAIGCELAQAFARFGSEVTMVESMDRILGKDDPEAGAIVRRAMEADGIRILTSTGIDRVEEVDGGRRLHLSRADGEGPIEVDQILVATGRRPNLESLHAERAGVEVTRKGVSIDERMRTTNPSIYAIGDVASKWQFTHAADAQARLVVRNALFFGRGKASDLIVPWCTYTSPELAHVGITPWEEGAEEIETLTIPFADVDRARLSGRTEGFVRVHLEKGGDTIRGATAVGEGAGDLISFFTAAMTAGQGLSSFSNVIFPYPTMAEAVRKAADMYNRRRLTSTAKRAMDTFFKVVG